MADLLRETYSSASMCPPQLLQVPVKGDVIVPDTKPDADKILQTSVRYMPADAALEHRKVRVQGELEFTVLYLSQEEMPALRSLTSVLPVEEEINLDGIMEEDDRVRFQIAYTPENIRSTLLNGRKLSLSALLEIEVQVTKYEDTAVIMDVAGEENLVLNRIQKPVSRLVGDKEEKLIVRESEAVKDGSPNIQEILWWDASIRNRSCRLLEDKVQVKGEIAVSVLYQTENGVQFFDYSTDFAGLLEVSGCKEDMEAALQMEIVKGFVHADADADGEQRVLQMEMIVSCRVRVCEEQMCELVVDAYDTKQDVLLEKPLRFMQHQIYRDQLRADVAETLEIPENMPMALQVFYTTARVKVDDYVIEDGKLQIEGVLYVTVFCLTADDRSPVISFTQPVPFEKSTAVSGAEPGQNVEIVPYLESVRSELRNEKRLDMKASLALEVSIVAEERQEVLTELLLQEGEVEELPAMALYYLQPGETVWDVGKRYRVLPDCMEKMGESVVMVVR